MPRIAIWSDLGILGMSAWAGVRHGDSRQRPCARRARTSVLFRFRLRHGLAHRRGLFASMAEGALDPSRAAPRSYPCLAVHGLDGVLRLPDAPDHQRRAGAAPAAGLDRRDLGEPVGARGYLYDRRPGA